MKILKEKTLLLIFVIVFVGFLLRIIDINSTPPSLNWDEVSHGYNAYSILKTGRDEWGVAFPTIFRAYGDYKLPIYIYLTTVPVFLLGLTQFSVRIVSIMAGTLSIFFVYQLINKLFENKRLALITSLLFAINPWNLFLSRIAVEANLALFFIISGSYFLLAGLKEKNRQVVLGVFLLGLSVWTYNSARIFTPLLLIAFLVNYWKDMKSLLNKNRKITILTSIVGLVFFAPMFYQLFNPTGLARYGWVKIVDEGMVSKIIEARVTSIHSPIITKFLHNRVTYFSLEAVKNYFGHFDPKFLFFKGGSNYQFNVPGYGLLYAIGFPFFIIGLVKGFLDAKKSKSVFFAMCWLAISPIASSLTKEAPHALRSVVMLPIPMLLTSVGLVTIYESLVSKSKVILYAFVLIVCCGYLVSAINYFSIYRDDYRLKYSWSWQYGYKEVIDYSRDNYAKYDKIIMTKKYGEPHEYVLFWNRWNPEAFRTDANLIRFQQSDWYWVDGFDKYYFVNDWEIVDTNPKTFQLESKKEVDCTNSRCLLITSPGNVPVGWNKLEEFQFLDGKPAFEIYEN